MLLLIELMCLINKIWYLLKVNKILLINAHMYMKCRNCGKPIPSKIKVKNKIIRLTSRKFCTKCSPIGARNTRQYIVNTKENESYCPRCDTIKKVDQFYKIKGRIASYCKDCQKEVKRIKAEEKLHQIIEMKGGMCVECNGVFPTPVYVFHNGTKSFPQSKIQHLSIDKLLGELKDHFLLCRNCEIIREWITK